MVGLTILAMGALLVLMTYVRQAAKDYLPSYDFAVIESYTLYAAQGKLYVGPYSRLGWHHPGPMMFYVFAPFYVMSGHRHAGLSAAALAINLVSLAVIIGIPVWVKKYVLASATAALMAAYIWRLQPILVSPWNPHVLVLPTMALVFSCTALASGRLVMMPVVATVATFVVQTHAGLAPTVVPIVAFAASIAIRSTRESSLKGERRRLSKIAIVTGFLLLLLWFLPIAEQLRNTPDNMTNLWRYFVLRGSSGLGPDTAFAVWSDILSGLFRPDFQRAWGSKYELGQLEWPRLAALAAVLTLGAVCVRAAARRDRFRSSSAGLLLAASLAALWSVARIDETELYDHAVFWISGIGVLNTAVIIDAVVAEFWPHRAFVPSRVAMAICGASMLWAAAVSVQQLRVVVSRSFRPGTDQLAARRLSDAIEPSLGPGTKPLIRIDSATWPVAAGVILQLQKDHVPFAVEQPWISMFTPAAKATGDATHTLAFVRTAERDRLAHEPGSTVIAERDSISVVLSKR